MATTAQCQTRSENQLGASLQGRHSHAVYGIVVFWQTFINGLISAAPLQVEEGAESKDLQHGADQSSLFERLRLGEVAIKISLVALRDRITLVVPFNTTPSFLREVASWRTLLRPTRIGST